MIPASSVKKTIEFNARFRALLEVLKLVAVSQYHILEKKLHTFEALKDVVSDFFGSIDLTSIRHPFLQTSDKPIGVVAVTSDAGLLGGMNMSVVTKAVELCRNGGALIIVGERGQVYAQDMGVPFKFFPGVVDSERFIQAAQLRDFLTQKVISGQLGGIKVVYPRALSLVVNRIEVETLIPFSRQEDDKKAGPGLDIQSANVIVESRARDVIEYLVYLLMGQRLYEIFGMARLAEQAARFLHLEESGQKILEMNKKLLLQYFRRRHEVIDAQMRELFSARSLFVK